MKREIKKFFKNYSDDFQLSRDINETKSRIEFERSNQKNNKATTIFSLKHVLIVAITILMVAPVSIFIGYKYRDNYWARIEDRNEQKHVIQQVEKRFDKYLEHSVETLIINRKLELAFYLGMKDNEIKLLIYSESSSLYEVTVFKDEIEKEKLNTINRQISFFELDDAIFQLKLQIEENGETIKEKIVDFDLTEHIRFLQAK